MHHVGLIGLGTMGSNLARNISRKPNTHLHLYSRNYKGAVDGIKNSTVYESIPKLVQGMGGVDREFVIMLPNGMPIDSTINAMIPHMHEGDVVIDGANEHFTRSRKRGKLLENVGAHYLGAGISGGSSGALKGPSIMVGGSPLGYRASKELLDHICSEQGNHQYYGDDYGAGHFVKTVHNGVEYAMMQSLCEVYDSVNHESFLEFIDRDMGNLEGFLISLTRSIDLNYVDTLDDEAMMNSTGTWCAQHALLNNIPIGMIVASVNARILSMGFRGEGERPKDVEDVDIQGVLEFAFASALWEGLLLCDSMGADFEMAKRNWSSGAIITTNMLDVDVSATMHLNYEAAENFRTKAGCPLPAINAALDAYKTRERRSLSMALVMAQRNAFGGHPVKFKD